MPSPKSRLFHNCLGWPDSYQWTARTKNPKCCPRCKAYLGKPEPKEA